MNNELGPEFANAIRLILTVAKWIEDPEAGQKIRKLQAQSASAMEFAKMVNPTTEEISRSPKKGTCPTCGNQYSFKGEVGGIRRHGKSGNCFSDTQMAAEIIPAVRLIACLGDMANGDSGGESSE